MLFDYFRSLYLLTAEMAPYLLFGFLVAGILKIYVPQKYLAEKLGKSNAKSVFYGALFGVPLPLCSCGVIPTGISIRKNGASDGATIAFLISTPQTGVDSIMITWSMLGWPFALLRPFIAFTTGIFGGLIGNWFQNSESKAQIMGTLKPDENAIYSNQKSKLTAMFRYAFFSFIDDIVKWLTIGLLFAAAIEVLVPDSFIEQNIGNPWVEMIFALIVSVPLYICATGSVPLAAVLMLKGLSPGAALVILMAGPATNIATITVINRVMGNRNLAIYLFAIMAGALFFGAVINQLFPSNYFQNFVNIQPHSLHNHQTIDWVNTLSVIILISLILLSFYRKFNIKKKSEMKPVFNQYSVIVEGMTCQHCEANVERNLNAIEEIQDVKADRNSNKVTFTSENPDFNQIEAIVKSIGYKYVGKD